MRYGQLGAVLLGAALALLSVGVASAERGYTTWYGPGFHGNVTANGDRFDENDPTTTAAAYRYPFGTWLRVTNPANGKSVTVRVNDRGAFGHALDLSKAAFFALGPPNSWGFWVDIEVVSGPNAAPARQAVAVAPPAPPKPAPAPPAPKPAAAAPAPRPAPKPAAPATEHVVDVGQTLRGIAALHGVPLRALIDWNAIETPDSLMPGQKLRLTAPTSTYEVQPGDTLNSIAKSLGIARATILELNEIEDPNSLSIGQKLVVPS